MNNNEVRGIIKEAFMPHFEQIPHSPGLFLDGYIYRAKHQDSLSMAIDDSATVLDDLIQKAIQRGVKEGIDKLTEKLTAQHESDED